MQIFEQEKLDGLEEQISNNLSLSYTSALSLVDNKKPELIVHEKTLAELKDFDLHYLESVLASVGWNLNDDVFDKEETIKASQSSVHKRFNYMHDEADIIGHIVSSKIVDEAGKVCADLKDIPDKFDVVDGSVIYKHWEDEERQSRITKIIAEIQEGKWCVSMECLFSDFDYAVITPKNEHKVIARNKESSFLTKYLKVYGGNGVYKDYKVGRLLKNFVFSGKGLVDNPGNPRSVILSTSNFKGNIANLDLIRENSMAEANELDVLKQEIKAEKARADAAEKVAKDASDKELNSLKETVKNLTSELATANQKIVNLQSNVEVLNTANEELKTSKTTVEKTLTEVLAKAQASEAIAKKANRLSVLKNKTIEEAKAIQLVDKFISSDDDTWSVLVDSLSDKNAKETTVADLNSGVITDKTIASITSDDESTQTLEKAKAWISQSLQSGSNKDKK